jgi:hypothetical protein
MIFILAKGTFANSGDEQRLWLKFNLISDAGFLNEYKNVIKAILVNGESMKFIQAAVIWFIRCY